MSRASANSPMGSGNYDNGVFRKPKATIVAKIADAKALLTPLQYSTMEYKGYHAGYEGHLYIASVDKKNKRIVVAPHAL